jgi:hypothetical protein
MGVNLLNKSSNYLNISETKQTIGLNNVIKQHIQKQKAQSDNSLWAFKRFIPF